MMRYSSGREQRLRWRNEAPRTWRKRSVKNSTPALKRYAAARRRARRARRARARAAPMQSMRTIWFGSNRTSDRERTSRSTTGSASRREIGASCGHVTQMLIGVPLRNAPQHALAGVLEPVALGGIERAPAAAAFVVALERTLEDRACRRRKGSLARVPAMRVLSSCVASRCRRARDRRRRGVAGRRARRKPRRAAPFRRCRVPPTRALHERAIARVNDRRRRVGLERAGSGSNRARSCGRTLAKTAPAARRRGHRLPLAS